MVKHFVSNYMKRMGAVKICNYQHSKGSKG